MSISSVANPSNRYSYPLVLQQGLLTQSTANPITVACPDILATDTVLLTTITQTAPNQADNTAPNLGIYGVAITAGTGFVATPVVNTIRGTYYYRVLRSNAPVVNSTSPA